MLSRLKPILRCAGLVLLLSNSFLLTAQKERHGRGYKPLPPTAQVVVTVQKGFNQKPLPNASVVFRSERDGSLVGNLETKTDPEGRASIDLLEVGTHVTVQVIATGFATYATDFDLTRDGKEILAKLQRPRAQVSGYVADTNSASRIEPGVQEHEKPKPVTPGAVPPPAASPTSPLATTPPANTPATQTSPGAPQ